MKSKMQVGARRAMRRARKWAASAVEREGRLWLWFVAAACGVAAKAFMSAALAGQPWRLTWTQVGVSVVASMVTFGDTYQRYRQIGPQTPMLVQASVAFQCGFFWQTVFGQLSEPHLPA